MTKTSYILTLPSIHFVMKMEKEALARGIAVELIPTPRQISTDCGMAVKFRGGDLDRVLKLMSGTDMPEGTLYRSGTGDYELMGSTAELRKAPGS